MSVYLTELEKPNDLSGFIILTDCLLASLDNQQTCSAISSERLSNSRMYWSLWALDDNGRESFILLDVGDDGSLRPTWTSPSSFASCALACAYASSSTLLAFCPTEI